MLRPAFRRALWTTYDHIGLLVAANLLWVVLTVPVVTAPAAAAGLFTLAHRASRRERVSLRDFFAGFREHAGPSLRLGVFDLAVTALLWFNIDFYSHLGGPAEIPGMLLAGALVWVAAFLLLMHAHLYPLLVGGERSLRRLLRKSALLTLDNLAFTVGLTFQALSLTALCVVTGAGLVLINGSLVSVLLTAAHDELSAKYGGGATPPAPETRTFRDLWRPWDSTTPRD